MWLSFIHEIYILSNIGFVFVAKRDLLQSKVHLNSHTYLITHY